MKNILLSAFIFAAASVQCTLQDKLTAHQAEIKTIQSDIKAGSFKFSCHGGGQGTGKCGKSA